MSRLCRISAKNWTFGFRLFSTLVRMNLLHIECPHCGGSFDVELQSEKANTMVFSCARCNTPLIYCHGEVGELDQEEFSGLRQKLTRAIDAAISRNAVAPEVAKALMGMLDSAAVTSEPHVTQETKAETSKNALTDESLNLLQKELDELDAESFLDQL